MSGVQHTSCCMAPWCPAVGILVWSLLALQADREGGEHDVAPFLPLLLYILSGQTLGDLSVPLAVLRAHGSGKTPGLSPCVAR